VDLRRFVDQLVATPISGFFGMDVVSSIVLWVVVVVDGRRAAVRHLWAPVIANLAVGVSLGLPLFLYMREDAAASPTSTGRVLFLRRLSSSLSHAACLCSDR
jgi:hypothetical protein